MSFLITPALFVMAYITYQQPSPICTISGPFGFLSSMWLMYAIMAVVHSGPWWSLIRFERKTRVPEKPPGVLNRSASRKTKDSALVE